MKMGLVILLILLVVLFGLIGWFFFTFTLVRHKPAFMVRLIQKAVFSQMEEPEKENPFKGRPEDHAWNEAQKGIREEPRIVTPSGYHLQGYFYPGTKPHQVLILVHGYTGTHVEHLQRARGYNQRGYGVLLMDLRGCGRSEGNYYGMCYTEKEDLSLWIDWVLQKDPEAHIGLLGVSMGAATVMMSVDQTHGGHVMAAVEDCGYTCVQAELAYQMKTAFHLPTFPFVTAASCVNKLVQGFTFKQADAMAVVRKAQMPLCFIHGEADTFVPFAMMNQLVQACPTTQAVRTYPGVGHGASCFLDPEDYLAFTEAFFARNL